MQKNQKLLHRLKPPLSYTNLKIPDVQRLRAVESSGIDIRKLSYKAWPILSKKESSTPFDFVFGLLWSLYVVGKTL